jgi:hypothetical protein
MSTRDEVKAALADIPVSWLHMPGLAAAAGSLPQAKDETPQPKIAPIVAAGIGVAVGAGIQLGHQMLHDKSIPQPTTKEVGLTCSLTFKQLEDNATKICEESQGAKDGGALKAIVDASNGAKVAPAIAAAGYFLAGVAAGAAAARH